MKFWKRLFKDKFADKKTVIHMWLLTYIYLTNLAVSERNWSLHSPRNSASLNLSFLASAAEVNVNKKTSNYLVNYF